MDKKQLESALQRASALGVLVLYHIYQHRITLTEFAKQADIPLGTVYRYVYNDMQPRSDKLDKVLGVIGEIDSKLMRAVCDPMAVAADYARDFMLGYLGNAEPEAPPLTQPESVFAEAPGKPKDQ